MGCRAASEETAEPRACWLGVHHGFTLSKQAADLQGLSLQELFIRAAAVSRLQWHPFTVIAGDQPNTYIAYIKACGGWTRGLISR